MKVTFIYLPHPYLKQPDAQAPLGLMYLAAVLEIRDFEVDIKNYSSFTMDAAIADIEESDVFGITATSLEIPIANVFAALLKNKYPKAKILIGGPGTVTPDYVDTTAVDSIVMGEAELTILDVLKDVQLDKLAPLYHGVPVPNLDWLPLPARHLLNDTKQGGDIFAYGKNYHENGSTVILTSRGCPFNCAFCSSRFIGERNVRFRSPENVVKEMKDVIDNYNIYQFRISDDMFTASIPRARKLCELIGPLGVSWRISTRTKPVDKDLFKLMAAAGCKEISFGVESFDNNVLKVLKKGTTARENAIALKAAADAGIKTRVLFMIRTPGQTKDTVPANIKMLKVVPFTIICCTTFVPLPGSAIWDDPGKYGVEIIDRNLENYNFYFYSKTGPNELKEIIRLKDRDPKEVEDETLFFRDYLKSTGRLNVG